MEWSSGVTLAAHLFVRGSAIFIFAHPSNTVHKCEFMLHSGEIIHLHGTAHMPMSPAAAAKKAGVSRSLISREIKNGSLKATLKNNGHHAIAEGDLQDWMNRRTDRASAPEQAPPEPVVRPDADRIEVLSRELADTRTALARLEGQAEATAARIADLTADRDAWRSQAERLSEARPLVPVGLWARLFGR